MSEPGKYDLHHPIYRHKGVLSNKLVTTLLSGHLQRDNVLMNEMSQTDSVCMDYAAVGFGRNVYRQGCAMEE